MLRPLSLSLSLLATEAISPKGYPRGVNERGDMESEVVRLPNRSLAFMAADYVPPPIPHSLYWRCSAERPSINHICKILHQPCKAATLHYHHYCLVWTTPLPPQCGCHLWMVPDSGAVTDFIFHWSGAFPSFRGGTRQGRRV